MWSRYKSKSSLNNHMKIHEESDEKRRPFSCSHCQDRFTRNSSKKRHERKHRLENNDPDSLCQKRFYRKDKLDRHKLVHTGEKRFARQSHVQKHVQSIHKKDKKPKKTKRRYLLFS
eukprot:26403_1